MNAYEVISLRCSTKNIYSLILHFFQLAKNYKNHVFVIECNAVDDSLFNLFLEYSFISGNKVVYSKDYYETCMAMWNCAKKNKENYYYFDCL